MLVAGVSFCMVRINFTVGIGFPTVNVHSMFIFVRHWKYYKNDTHSTCKALTCRVCKSKECKNENSLETYATARFLLLLHSMWLEDTDTRDLIIGKNVKKNCYDAISLSFYYALITNM